MKQFYNIRAIAFDADDTLWDCQGHFDEVERQYAEILSPWATPKEVAQGLLRTETANMPSLGYGCKAYTLSLIENAIRLSGGKIGGVAIGKIMFLGRALLDLPATPLPTVSETLETLKARKRYRLAVFTKGELLDQENKLQRSGLLPLFDCVEIVSDKTEEAYRTLCRHMGVSPKELLMVGNSFKSDIEPALAIGANAVYVPFHATWMLEHTEEYDHERLARIGQLSELPGLL